ncbi:MAG: 1,4-beta-glucanase, partial [Ruminococcus sp.]|nr:1,4-beta-glucanase [Ruminococcus sp.]
MKKMKKITAGILALCLSAVCLSQTTGIRPDFASAADDISAKMEWNAVRLGGGGFVSGIVTGKKVMYARTDVGGAYKYNYDTDQWEQLLGDINDADRGYLSVDAMAIDPTDENTVYFLCGCAYFTDAKTAIFKTTDGGKTFERIDIT